MPNLVFIAVSIDGYIVRSDGNIDWLSVVPNPEKNDYGYSEFMARIDAIVMGRKTFETVLRFSEWPYVKQVIVLSETLKKLPDRVADKAEIMGGESDAIVAALNRRGLHTLYIDGGKTIQGFLQKDLIDEMVITQIPIVLGSGVPLFGSMEKELSFRHVKTDIYANSIVQSRYVRNRS